MNTGTSTVLMWAALSFAGFLGHLVGDYLVQNNWMAQNKAKDRTVGSIVACFVHALTWGWSVQVFMTAVAFVAWGPGAIIPVAWACGVKAAIHFVQDRRWPIQWFMRATGKDPSVLWLLIVVDNVWHLLQIAGAAAWIVWRMS